MLEIVAFVDNMIYIVDCGRSVCEFHFKKVEDFQMKKKLLSALLSVAMVSALLVGCGNTTTPATGDNTAAVDNAGDNAGAEDDGAAVAESTSTDPFYIYSWNTELGERLEYVFAEHPDWKDRVVYVNVGDSGVYQEKIDQLLATPDAEEYPDMMATEAGYIMKYTNSDYTLNVADLGVTDADMAEMYEYTVQIATDQRNGQVKGCSWQSCPGSYMYRRSLAEKYLGVSEPDDVQAYVKDWDTFLDTARKIAKDSNGATKILSSNDDVDNVFWSNKSTPWVDADKNFVYDSSLDKMLDVHYALEQENLTQKADCWSEAWNAGPAGDEVFSYFGCTWFLHWTIKSNCGGAAVGEGTYGDWAMCGGPQNYYWGGTWLCAMQNCCDPAFAGQLMKELCCNTELMTKMSEETLDYVNNKTAMKTLSDAGKGAYEFLGGQDFIAMFSPLAEDVDVSWMSSYDQKINELYGIQVKMYQIGDKDKDTAIADFKASVADAYPDITVE